MRLKLSVSTNVFASNIRNALESAMVIGVEGIQFDLRNELVERDYGETARKQLLHYLSERRMMAASASFPLRSHLTDPQHLDDRVAALHKAIHFAAKLKLKSFVFRPGEIPAPDSRHQSEYMQILNELAETGNHVGVTLCMTPSGDSAAHLKSLIDSVKSGELKVDFDFAQTILSGQKISDELRGLFGHIGHLTARDAARGHGFEGLEVPVGQGETDWDEALALLSEMDYSGWMNLTRRSGSNRALDVHTGFQYLKKRVF